MTFNPTGLATAVGSLPYTDVDKAVTNMLNSFANLPAWPQLPNRSFLENMYIQYSEGLPCLIVDRDRERIFFDTRRDVMAEMEGFYAKVIEKNLDQFAVSGDYAAGFHRFCEVLAADEGRRASLSGIKGQIVGPVSFGLTVTDQNKRAIMYHEDLMDAVVKTIALKAAWQTRELKKIFPEVMIWLDEPYLASFGSGYVSLSEDQVLSFIGEVVASIHEQGALAGIHCCGNTDWSLLMNTQIDIINFDAYAYFKGMTLYPDDLKKFFLRGGILAIGLVPTSDKIMEETIDTLSAKLQERLDTLSEKTGMSGQEIWKQCLLTPSCGTGSLPEKLADRVLELTGKVRLNA